MKKIIKLKESDLKEIVQRIVEERTITEQPSQPVAPTNSITTSTTSGVKPTTPKIVKKKGFDKTIATKVFLPGVSGGIYLKLYPQQYPTLVKIFNMVGMSPDNVTTFKNSASLQNTPIVFVDCSREKKRYYVVDKETFGDDLPNFCQVQIDDVWLKKNPSLAVEIPKSNYGGANPEIYKVV